MVVGFDFDGVIINSLPSMRKSWSDLSNKLNIKNYYSEYIKHIGLKFFDILDNLNIDNIDNSSNTFLGDDCFDDEIDIDDI